MNWSFSHPLQAPLPEFVFGTLRLEPDGTLRRGGDLVHLAPKEESALRLLLERAGQIVTPRELKEYLWPDVYVTPESVARCVSSLRARLEPEDCIQTVYKRGYRLTGPVQRQNGAAAQELPRLAILPFEGGPHVPEDLGPAIAEDCAARLTAQTPQRLLVLARDSVFALANKGMAGQQVGQTLKADLVLAGRLTALPVCYRLRVEMIRVADGTQIWVEDMLAPRGAVAALQAELVDKLAFRLGSGNEPLSLAPRDRGAESANPAAFENYLRGHHQWQTLERHRMLGGIQLLNSAVELDPQLIAAKTDLVHASVAEALFGFLSPTAAADQVRAIAQTIPNLPETAPAILPALGWISLYMSRDLLAALDLFSQCAHLGHSPWTTRLRTMLALSRHRFDDAQACLEQALAEDPYAPWLLAHLAWAHHLAGEAEPSLRATERAIELFPDDACTQLFGSIVLAFQGQAELAVEFSTRLAQRTPYFDVATAAHAYALARAGRRDEAESLRERLQWLSRERYVVGAFTPAVSLALGDTEGALADLAASENARCPWFFQMLADPRLAELRGTAEFQQMQEVLRRMETAVEDFEHHPEAVSK